MTYSIVIIDDHVLIANALRSIISNFSKFKVLYVCGGGKEFIDNANGKEIPDIVLLDVNMPIVNGFETAKWIKENYPKVKIMALSMQDDEQSLIKMIRNGARGYVLKNILPSDLNKALNKLVESGYFFPEWATQKVFTSIGEHSISVDLKSDLSDREVAFLKYSATEMTYKEIAEQMFCSPRTIENYRDSLFDKLNIKSRVGLAAYAIRNGYSD